MNQISPIISKPNCLISIQQERPLQSKSDENPVKMVGIIKDIKRKYKQDQINIYNIITTRGSIQS